jgi:hypothetical protein
MICCNYLCAVFFFAVFPQDNRAGRCRCRLESVSKYNQKPFCCLFKPFDEVVQSFATTFGIICKSASDIDIVSRPANNGVSLEQGYRNEKRNRSADYDCRG